MKKLLLILLVLISFSAMSQEKGSYITLSGGIGPSGFKYGLKDVQFMNDYKAGVSSQLLFGGQTGLGYSYYFHKHWGISIGAGVSCYRTNGLLNYYDKDGRLITGYKQDLYFDLGNYKDNDYEGNPQDFNLRARTKNWSERQSTRMFEIPVTFNFQHKFGYNEYWGLYAAIGAKFQLPFQNTYWINNGEMNISGYYAEKNLELGFYGDPPLNQHGFGVTDQAKDILINSTGDVQLKFGVAAIGEAGFLFSLSRRVDVTLGGFIDYGFLNMNREKSSISVFTGPKDTYHPESEYNVAKNIEYSQLITSEYVDKVTGLSYGGKIGIRVKLGKLSERPLPCENDTVYIEVPAKDKPGSKPCKDTVYVVLPPDQPKPHEPNTPPSPAVTDDELNYLMEPIYFDLDKSDLKPESKAILDKKVSILKKHTNLDLLILGNTCDLGASAHNVSLGMRRAESAKSYLVNNGIQSVRLQTLTQSSNNPEMPNDNEFKRQHNRRDDFKPILK